MNKSTFKKINYVNNKYNLNCEIYAVDGSTNPTGSIKDVTVYNMLKAYAEAGVLKKGSTIIEATSGNTGISLAYFQKEFDYKCIIVMPDSMSIERRKMISEYGAQLFLVTGGMVECNNKANELLKKIDNSFIFDQFKCPYNDLAHYLETGPFIYNNLNDVDIVFAGIGTGGTISGTAKYLKEQNKDIKVIGIEPLQSPLITKGYSGSHLIQGIGANFIPSTLDLSYIDEVITVDGEESIKMAKEIRSEEKLDIGISSGASLLGCINYIKENNIINKKIVVIFPDKGNRYNWN